MIRSATEGGAINLVAALAILAITYLVLKLLAFVLEIFARITALLLILATTALVVVTLIHFMR